MLAKIIFILALTISSAGHANELLDIRPHEASDECDGNISQVRVLVSNVGAGGILTVELYNDPENFLNKKGRLRRIRIAAEEQQHGVCFTLEQADTYAVVAYHDIDANRKLNKKWNMMPKEPFGLSMNPKLKFGFPKFKDSAFTTDASGADIEIKLIDP